MCALLQKGTRMRTLQVLLCCLSFCSCLTAEGPLFRNNQNPEDVRDGHRRDFYDRRNLEADRARYNTGPTYHGSVSRYDRGRYEVEQGRRGFDNRYDDDLYGTGVLQGYAGRRRPAHDTREWELLKLEERIGVLEKYRPDLQGELRPGEIPGENLPLAEDLFVKTDSGTVQGFYVYLYDKPGVRPQERPVMKDLDLQRYIMNVSTFLGIPYARPPIMEGRFKPPRRVLYWHSTKRATDFAPACPQNLKYIGTSNGIRNGIDEDCLYLNVFTPSISANHKTRYPVMFHIHGGDFDHGASNQFPGHMLAAWGEVVVVTFNYRLGALGFLSTGDENSPGNYGLMDMARALEWVHGNVRFFNGDPSRITAFGPGSGGAAAGLLAVLPKSKDWVSQVIAESGSPLADWAAIDDVYRVQNTSRVYGLEVGCSVESSYKLVQCLNRRNFEELASVHVVPDVGTFAWSPVVDANISVPLDEWYEDWDSYEWHILPELPARLYERNQHHPLLRYLTGVNRDEAASMVFEDARLRNRHYEVTEDFFNERVKEWVKHYNYSLNPEGAYDAIKWMYTFWPDPHNTTHIREQYVHMLSDALYKSGVDEIVKLLVNTTYKRGVPTYYYLLNTTVEALRLPYWREVPNNIEYYFLSGAPFMDPDFYPDNVRVSRQLWTEGDRNISEFMMKTFTNFAKWGNPTEVEVEVLKAKWYPVREGTLQYLSINTTFNTSTHYNYRQPQCTFWYEYMPLVVREWVPTPPPPRNPWTDMTEPVTAALYGFIAVTVALLVGMCVCFGLWKSANRQRNKALDDLQYYSTENLSLAKENDYAVKSYLDKMEASAQSEAARSVTPITTTSSEHFANFSQPYSITQSLQKVPLAYDKKAAPSVTPRLTISEPDGSFPVSPSNHSQVQVPNRGLGTNSVSCGANLIQNSGKPFPQIVQRQEVAKATNHPEPLPRNSVKMKEKPGSTGLASSNFVSSNKSEDSCRPLLPLKVIRAEQEGDNQCDFSELLPPYTSECSAKAFPGPQKQDNIPSHFINRANGEVNRSSLRSSMDNLIKAPEVQPTHSARPNTPSASSITFEISMKPSKSGNGFSTAGGGGGGILNTDL